MVENKIYLPSEDVCMTAKHVDVELPAGTILKLTGIPIELLSPTIIRATPGNWELLRNWGVVEWEKKKKNKKEEPIQWEEEY